MKTRMKAQLAFNCIFLLLFTHSINAQKTFFGITKPDWEHNSAFAILKAGDRFSGSDAVIIDEKAEFYFFSRKNEKVKKRLLVKINTEKGVAEFENFRLPESFDFAKDAHYYKQGRNAKIKTPFIYDFRVISLAARKFTGGSWHDVVLDYKYETEKYVGRTGVFIKDETLKFMLKDLMPGDVIDLMYEMEFDSDYGNNIFYFHSKYPKLLCETVLFIKLIAT